MIRQAKFAGYFYPADKKNLTKLIESCFLSPIGPGRLPVSDETGYKKAPLAIICPHAGYQFSGSVAAWSYFEAAKGQKKITVILIGPNHSAQGSDIAIYPPGAWITPLGQIEIDEEIVNDLAEKGLSVDETGHNCEHSIEVQLPFLQYIYGSNFQIVCISMLDQSKQACDKLSDSLAKVLIGKEYLIVATSDLTHYSSMQKANEQDSELLKSLQSNDPNIIYETRRKLNASACGIGPLATAVKTGLFLGARETRVLKYETSAATTGDFSSVVGYASLAIY